MRQAETEAGIEGELEREHDTRDDRGVSSGDLDGLDRLERDEQAVRSDVDRFAEGDDRP